MYLTTLTKTGVGRSGISAPDHFQCPFNVGVGATVSGSVTFDVQVTMDDPLAPTFSVSTANWITPSGFSGLTANTALALNIPCRAICINVTSGAGTATVQLVQAGPV